MPALLGTRRVPYLGGAWTPARLPGCVLWLDAAVISQADNTSVARWTDQSGKGNHALQGTVAAQPTYLAAGLGGRPAVQFEGVDDWLDLGATPSLNLTGALTFLVACTVPLGSFGMLLTRSDGTSLTQWEWERNGTTSATILGADVGGVRQSFTGPTYASASHVHTLLADPAVAATFAVDGVAATAHPYSPAGAFNAQAVHVVLGARNSASPTNFLSASIGAVLVYARVLAAGERHQVEAWVGARYGIAVTAG